MPRRVNPVILLGIIIVAVMSFGLSAGAAPEDGAVPESVLEKGVTPNEVTAPVVEPSGEGGAPSEVSMPESTIAPGEGRVPEVNVPVGDAVPEEDVAPNGGAAASEEQEDALKEVTTPEESPAQEDAEGDVAKDVLPEEAEIGEVAYEKGAELDKMLDEATEAYAKYDKALLEERQLAIDIAEARNNLANTEERLEKAQKRHDDRALNVYKDGLDVPFGVLLRAKNTGEFKDLLGLLVQLFEKDQEVIQEEREDRDRERKEKQDLDAKIEKLEESKQSRPEPNAEVEEAQEFFEAQPEEIQQKFEEERDREAELALEHVGEMLQDATEEQLSEPIADEEDTEVATGDEAPSDETGQAEEDQSEMGANETTGGEQAVQLAGEDKSEEIDQARQAGVAAPDRTPAEEQARQGEVAKALAVTIEEWQAQKKSLKEAVEEPVKEREAGAASEGGPSGTQAQNPAAEQRAAVAEEQAKKALEHSTKATEDAAAEKEARENATTQAQEAEKAQLAVKQLPAAKQEAARAAAQEAERNAAIAAEKAANQKLAAEEAAKKAVEQQDLAIELEEAAGQKPAENGILPQPKLGTSGGGVLDYAETWMGVPYDYSHMGGMTRARVDCSAFTAAVYKKFGITLPDSPVGQLGMGAPVSGPAKAGDLVFFSEDHSGVPTHVGIANGDGTLTHASNFTGEVSVTDMDYLTGYMGARRVM